MRLLLRFCLWAVPLLIVVALLLVGSLMPLWSQNNDLRLSDSDSTLQTWSELYNQGRRIYEQQNSTLENLNREISTLRIGYAELMNLSGQLSQSNENLREYNEQIAERMQERDEDLYWAYQEIDELELSNAKKDKKISDQRLVIFVLCGALLLIMIGGIVFAIAKSYLKAKLPVKI